MAKLRKRTWRTSKGEARAGWAVDFFDSSGTCQRRQFTSRREADDFRIEIEGQLRKGTFRPDPCKFTLEEAAELFLKYCAGRMRRGERMTRHNYAVYVGHIRNYICPDPVRHAQTSVTRKRSSSRTVSATSSWPNSPIARSEIFATAYGILVCPSRAPARFSALSSSSSAMP